MYIIILILLLFLIYFFFHNIEIDEWEWIWSFFKKFSDDYMRNDDDCVDGNASWSHLYSQIELEMEEWLNFKIVVAVGVIKNVEMFILKFITVGNYVIVNFFVEFCGFI